MWPGAVMKLSSVGLSLYPNSHRYFVGCNERYPQSVTANVRRGRMSSLWEQRAARNEALFREVNENIARLEERHGTTPAEPVFLCECANADCTDHVSVEPEVYAL